MDVTINKIKRNEIEMENQNKTLQELIEKINEDDFSEVIEDRTDTNANDIIIEFSNHTPYDIDDEFLLGYTYTQFVDGRYAVEEEDAHV